MVVNLVIGGEVIYCAGRNLSIIADCNNSEIINVTLNSDMWLCTYRSGRVSVTSLQTIKNENIPSY